MVCALTSNVAVQQAKAEERIRAVNRRDGRPVLTNLATYTPEALVDTPGAVALGTNLDTLVDHISAEHGVDPALTRAVIQVESNFDPRAVSPKGARGLMQLMPGTGARFGVGNFFDPAENIQGGVQYLKFLLEKFDGTLDLVLAAYNAGENLVARLGRIPAIPETENYVRKVRSVYTSTTAEGPGTRGAAQIYRTVDKRGVVRFSNLGGS